MIIYKKALSFDSPPLALPTLSRSATRQQQREGKRRRRRQQQLQEQIPLTECYTKI